MIDREQAEMLLEQGGHLLHPLGTGSDAHLVDAGRVLRVYLDEYTGWPSFCTLAAHELSRQVLVALHEAELVPGQDGIVVPYTQERIANAPTVANDQDPSVSEEDVLFDYYDVPIEGVLPAVDHLGSVLVPSVAGQAIDLESDVADGTTVQEHELGARDS